MGTWIIPPFSCDIPVPIGDKPSHLWTNVHASGVSGQALAIYSAGRHREELITSTWCGREALYLYLHFTL